MIPKVENNRIVVLMEDDLYHPIDISELKLFLKEFENDKQDFDTPADKICWDMIFDIIDSPNIERLTDWDLTFINDISLQPLASYSYERRKNIRRIHEKLCLTL